MYFRTRMRAMTGNRLTMMCHFLPTFGIWTMDFDNRSHFNKLNPVAVASYNHPKRWWHAVPSMPGFYIIDAA
jgi:hypothetical protein